MAEKVELAEDCYFRSLISKCQTV